MGYNLTVFDLDGTLVDTAQGIINSVRYAEKKLNLKPLPLETVQCFIGPPPFESYQKYYGMLPSTAEKAAALHREYAQKYGVFEAKPYSGIDQLIKMLKQQGKQLGVATLKRQDLAVCVLKNMDLDQFDMVAGLRDEKLCTKRDLLFELLKHFRIEDKRETVLIGDSIYDALAAKEIGMPFIGVTYGYGFKTADAVMVYPNEGIAANIQDLENLLC